MHKYQKFYAKKIVRKNKWNTPVTELSKCKLFLNSVLYVN